jgi:hypothetical protein
MFDDLNGYKSGKNCNNKANHGAEKDVFGLFAVVGVFDIAEPQD